MPVVRNEEIVNNFQLVIISIAFINVILNFILRLTAKQQIQLLNRHASCERNLHTFNTFTNLETHQYFLFNLFSLSLGNVLMRYWQASPVLSTALTQYLTRPNLICKGDRTVLLVCTSAGCSTLLLPSWNVCLSGQFSSMSWSFLAWLFHSQRKQQPSVYPLWSSSKGAVTFKSPQSHHWCWS